MRCIWLFLEYFNVSVNSIGILGIATSFRLCVFYVKPYFHIFRADLQASTKSSSSSAKSVPSSETKSAPSLPLAKKAKSIDAQKVKEGTAKGKNISQVTASPPFKSKGNKKKQAAVSIAVQS